MSDDKIVELFDQVNDIPEMNPNLKNKIYSEYENSYSLKRFNYKYLCTALTSLVVIVLAVFVIPNFIRTVHKDAVGTYQPSNSDTVNYDFETFQYVDKKVNNGTTTVEYSLYNNGENDIIYYLTSLKFQINNILEDGKEVAKEVIDDVEYFVINAYSELVEKIEIILGFELKDGEVIAYTGFKLDNGEKIMF